MTQRQAVSAGPGETVTATYVCTAGTVDSPGDVFFQPAPEGPFQGLAGHVSQPVTLIYITLGGVVGPKHKTER